ncbi:MAG TPA: 50S ribosomal protein L11 methyltransferase [Bacteroidia bacterium]
MDYVQVDFKVEPVQPGSDVLIAILGEMDYESFVQNDNGFEAYIQKDLFNEESLNDLGDFGFNYRWTIQNIKQENWNEEWEKNFHPVLVEDKCCIRASFHEPQAVQLDIVINPKMSFGTGHHDTTWMMSRVLFDIDIKGKDVLDMGCGTGVLAIIAKKLGAAKVTGIDIDDWSIENSIENAELNDAVGIDFFKGNVEDLEGKVYDVILANINRNVLLAHLPQYNESLKTGGLLLLSGFFENDFEELNKKASSCGFNFESKTVRNGWAMLKYKK